MVTAGERLDKAGNILASLHRNGSQLQTGNPTFGTGFQRVDVFCGKVQAHYLIEKFGGFGGGKA